MEVIMKKTLKVLALMLVLCLMFTACAAPKADAPAADAPAADAPAADAPAKEDAPAAEGDSDTIKIGMFSCLTGNNAASGAYDVKGAELAEKHVNEAGGVLGKKVELVVMDSTSDTNQSALILERELAARDLTAMIGNNSSMICLTELPVIEKYEVPTLTGAVNMDITAKGYKYIFRPACTGPQIGEQNVELIKYLCEKSGKDIKDYNVGIVYENSAYGKDTAAEYEAQCIEAGLDIKVNETYPAGAFTDASPIVTKLKNAEVDLVLSVSMAPDAKLIINTMTSMNYAPLIVGGGSGYIWPTLYEEMGSDVNGIISAAAWNYDSTNCYQVEGYEDIVKEFEETYGEFMSEQCGEVYAMFRMIVQAIEAAGSADGAAVRDEIAKLTTDNCQWFRMMQPGADGQVFLENGQQDPACPVIVQWQDDKPRTIWPREISQVKILDISGNPINE